MKQDVLLSNNKTFAKFYYSLQEKMMKFKYKISGIIFKQFIIIGIINYLNIRNNQRYQLILFVKYPRKQEKSNKDSTIVTKYRNPHIKSTRNNLIKILKKLRILGNPKLIGHLICIPILITQH